MAVSPHLTAEALAISRADIARRERAFERQKLRDALELSQNARLRTLGAAFKSAAAYWDQNAKRWSAPFARPVDPVRAVDLGQWPLRREQTAIDLHREETFRREAETVYERLCVEETGICRSPEKQAAAEAEERLLLEQSHELGRRLEAKGVYAYRGGPWGLWKYGVHTGTVYTDPRFRRCCILPHVAKQLRMPTLTALEAWLQRNPFARFWTFTGGKRCLIVEARERIRAMVRKLSRLNAEPFMRNAGVEIVFRSVELGTPELAEDGKRREDEETGVFERDEQGRALLHPHLHCVVQLRNGPLSKHRWSELLKQVWAFWGDHWDDARVIRNARECCKYVTKPGEMLALSDDDLVSLHAQLFRLKLVQPMGSLADDIKRRRTERKRLIRERTPEGPVLQEVADWARGVPANGASDFDDERFLPGNGALVQVDGETLLKLERAANAARARNWSSGENVCRVVSKSAPGFSPLGVKEPRVVVMGTVFDRAAVEAHPLVQRLRELTSAEWQAGLSLGFTRAHQLSGKSGPEFDFVPNMDPRPPPVGPPVWAVEVAK